MSICRTPANWCHDFSGCLYDWQSLIGAILAISAAAIGSILLYKQILQSDRHEKKRVERRLIAVRASLPLTLSQICEFASDSFGQLLAARSERSDDELGPLAAGFSPPSIPMTVISALQEVLEATDDPKIIDLISEIIREIQLISARCNSLLDPHEISGNFRICGKMDEYILQCARLHAISGSLFPFARRETDSSPDCIKWDQVYSFLFLKNVHEFSHPGVHAILKRRMNAWATVWPKVRESQQQQDQ
jgi:hypothetical protein